MNVREGRRERHGTTAVGRRWQNYRLDLDVLLGKEAVKQTQGRGRSTPYNAAARECVQSFTRSRKASICGRMVKETMTAARMSCSLMRVKETKNSKDLKDAEQARDAVCGIGRTMSTGMT